MKSSIIFIIALFTIVTVSAQTDKFIVTVEGLGCPFCAYGLEKKFKELKITRDIKIDIETGLMTFVADATKNLSLETVENQVGKAGYTAKAIKIERANGKTEIFNGSKAAADKGVKTETFKVYGNCGMCEARIEKAAQSLAGVTSAEWNAETKMLTVKYDAKKVALLDIHHKIASVGHDTDQVKAQKEIYDKLPGCCLYDRT